MAEIKEVLYMDSRNFLKHVRQSLCFIEAQNFRSLLSIKLYVLRD